MVWIFLQPFPALAQSPEELMRRGDRQFNQGDYRAAYDLYRQVYDQLEKVRPISPLLAEAINNMGAVYIVRDDYETFYRYFSAARTIKQGFAQRAVTRQADNLLVNGGFEDGLIFPWGTGHYERPDGKFRFGVWWNSKNARAFMKIDADIAHSGDRSLRLTNYSPNAPHVFSTLSQRIAPLEPNTTYRISCFIKGENLAPGAVSFTVDAAWTKHVRSLPKGTYDWQPYADTINIGHNNYIDFRILHVNTGTVWLDDIVIRKVDAFDEDNPYKQAERLFDEADYGKALEILLALEKEYQKKEVANTHVSLLTGRIFLLLGQYREALDRFNRAIENGYARAVIDLSELYYLLGDYDQAETQFRKAVDVVSGDQGTLSLVLNKLSRCYLAMGKLDAALKTQQRSYRILKHIEDRHGQAESLNQLGIIHQHKGRYDDAVGPFLNALETAQALEDRKLTSEILLNLAETERIRGKFDAADGYADRAMAIKTDINDPLGMVTLRHLQARLDVARGRFAQAKDRYVQAIAGFEALAADAADISRDTKATFMKRFSALYREYTDLLLKLYENTGSERYHHEAFQISEQARSRIFTEMITESSALQAFADTSNDPQFKDLLNRERLLNARIHGLEKQAQGIRKSGGIDTSKLLEDARQRRRDIREELVRKYPRYADLKKPVLPTLQDVQALLGPEEAVLSYFVTPGRTGRWTITREKIAFSMIPLDRDTLIRQCEDFRRVFNAVPALFSGLVPGRGDKRARRMLSLYSTQAAYRLYNILVGESAALLENKTMVYLALDDLLYKLPFETLLTRPFDWDPAAETVIGEGLRHAPFWVTSHAVAYLPSLSVLRSLRGLKKQRSGDQNPLVAFADPVFDPSTKNTDATKGSNAVRTAVLSELRTRSVLKGATLSPLPDTRDEALAVAEILGAPPKQDLFFQERATEYNLKQLPLAKFRHLLFATHGLMAGEFGPGTQPALALSFVNDPENDGLLEMGEILGLDLNADLVVLSACNTASGGGDQDQGEGFAGLTRSFMYAGAESLVVTLWSVESGSAKTLVQKMFQKAGDGSFGNALAAAKRDMIRAGTPVRPTPDVSLSVAHPIFWAPYVLVGEGD